MRPETAHPSRDALFRRVLSVVSGSALALVAGAHCHKAAGDPEAKSFAVKAQLTPPPGAVLKPAEPAPLPAINTKSEAREKAGAKEAPGSGAMGKKEADRKVMQSGLLGASNTFGAGGLGSSIGDAHGIGGLGLRGTGSGGGGLGAMRGTAPNSIYASRGSASVGVGYGSGMAMGTLSVRSYGAVAAGPSNKVTRIVRKGSPAVVQLPEIAVEGESKVPAPKELPPNAWTLTTQDHLSTFGADVDTASYTEARRALNESRLPDAATVRVEEFVNFFHYDYPAPTDRAFSVTTDLAPSPFEPGVQLLRVGVQGRRVSLRDRKVVHLTFLVDVSGSMAAPDRLPLAKESLKILMNGLLENDTVSLVTYAGGVREVLPPTPATQRERIVQAVDSLQSGGGTAMSSGMELAFRNAERELRPNEVSRVLVLTDGDANIGNTTHEEILKSIDRYVKEGVTLSTIGFGTGNYRDQMLEQLADHGNGNNFYVDDLRQARRIFQEQLAGTLEIIAKDLKLQVDFDPAAVKRYRLLGYENRDIADQDFRNDRVDSGDVGAGHSVTALYAVELVDDAQHLATVHVRAKAPSGERANEWEFPVTAAQRHGSMAEAPASFRLAVAAAGFAEALRGTAAVRYADVESLAATCGSTADVAELKALARRARELSASGR